MICRPCSLLFQCFLALCVTSCACGASADTEPQSALHDDFQLLQNSLSIRVGRLEELGYMPLHDSNSDLKLSREQVLAELQVANHARQLWEKRIVTLEGLLATPRHLIHSQGEITTWRPSSARRKQDAVPLRDAKMMIPFLVGCAAAGLAALTIATYEKARSEHDVPWYHDGTTMSKVLISAVCIWVVSGIFTFTGHLDFRSDSEDEYRHLTLIESIYFSVQILTTIGYGDLTPAGAYGEVFMVFYLFTGVTLIATLTTELIVLQLNSKMATVATLSPGKKAFWNDAGFFGFIVCVVFGTLFYGSIEGEEKTYFEAFYMSIVTLTTVGFGHYTCLTPVGQLVGSFWMLTGWVCCAQTVASIGDAVLDHRKTFQTKACAIEFYESLKSRKPHGDHTGSMDRADFICFELIRVGFSQSYIELANSKFLKVDVDKSQHLDAIQFMHYVDSLL